MQISENIMCPICKTPSKKIKNLDAVYIKDKLSMQFKTEISDDLDILNYEMMQCPSCTFEFAYPEVEGSGRFYDWVTSQPNYYVESRWEYQKVIEILSRESRSIKLLDVGCGDGQFFDSIVNNDNPAIDFYGLDPTPGSVEICKNKGYKVFCMDIKEFKSFYKDTLFDAVTSYHVLEHIGDPKQFLEQLCSILNPGGSLYVSTPYSAMDFELEWYDVLNHPPHHMGRWNLKSYQKVAELLGLKIEVFMPPSENLLKITIKSFLISIHGSIKGVSKIKIIKEIIYRPCRFLRHFNNQSKRVKVLERRAANVILVKFTKFDKAIY